MPFTPISVPEQSALRAHGAVIWALYRREVKTRFGRYKLGLVWALIQPVMLVALKTAIFGFILQATIPSIPYFIFLAAGFIPFQLFTGLIMRSMNALSSNEGLLVYRQVRPIDPFMARVLLEFLIFIVVMIGFVIVAIAVDATPDFADPLMIFISVASLLMISCGLGLFCSVLAHSHSEMEKIVPLLTTPLLFASCVLYPLSRVPSNYQPFFLWNPLVVIFESFRKGLYVDYPTADLPILYPFGVGIICLWLGISYYWKKIDILYLPSQS